MVVIAWLINLVAPVIFILGFLVLTLGNELIDTWLWIVCCISAVIGMIWGVVSWNVGVPPRWFWAKSSLFLFNNLVWSAIGTGFLFFLLPLAIWLLVVGREGLGV